MNLNVNQKIIIFLGMLMILISFLVPPCYNIFYGDKFWSGYEPFAIFKQGGATFIHIPTFTVQIILIFLITIGLVIIFHKKKNER